MRQHLSQGSRALESFGSEAIVPLESHTYDTRDRPSLLRAVLPERIRALTSAWQPRALALVLAGLQEHPSISRKRWQKVQAEELLTRYDILVQTEESKRRIRVVESLKFCI